MSVAQGYRAPHGDNPSNTERFEGRPLIRWSGVTEEPGVYILLNEDQVVYIGQSSNMLRRVMVHAEAGKPFREAIGFPMEGSTQSERMKIELRLIGWARGVLNTETVRGQARPEARAWTMSRNAGPRNVKA
jgi:predicted GIY-YIG superfamily endonuclease